MDSLASLPDHVGFDKRLEVQLLQDKRAEVVIRLDDLLQEDHYAYAQLKVEMSVIGDSDDLLVDYREELWAQKAGSVVASRDLSVAEKVVA